MKERKIGFRDIDIDTILNKKEKDKNTVSEDIAIVGIALQMPKADTVDKFWANIKSGMDCTGRFPVQRRNDADEYYQNINQEDKCDKYGNGSYLNEIDKFDYSFFHLSPKEASLMNPAQRIFLETAYSALEDAGYSPKSLSGSNTGVYVGYIGDYEGYQYKQMIHDTCNSSVWKLSATGNVSSIIPSRISYLLDLKGPSMLIDTACSSSLVAVHLACQAINNGDCDQAIAGGIRIIILPNANQVDIGIHSEDGKTRAFDNDSTGIGNGEGVVAVVLKKMSKAVEARDNIYAVIKGSAINQDGNSAGITAPNSVAQSEVITKAWERANISPETISYIEAHGTGTRLGDPIEIDGLNKAFEKYTKRKQFCALGTVKTNVGHLFGCAGIAGMVKAALSLKYKQLPPSINFDTPNNKIEFEKSALYMNTRLRKWDTDKNPRRCGVSAFGFSGTNCHLVMEENEDREMNDLTCLDRPSVLTISAKSLASLNMMVKRYVEFFDSDISQDVKDVAYTSNIGRDHFQYRIAIVFETIDDLKEKLSKINYLDVEQIQDGDIFLSEMNDVSGEERLELDQMAQSAVKAYLTSGKGKKELAELCNLYRKGADVNWKEIYAGEMRYHVSIPTYAFARNRCWIEADSNCSLTGLQQILKLAQNERISKELSDEITTTIAKWQKEIAVEEAAVTKEVAVELLGRTDNNYSEEEQRLAKIWEATLGFNQINVYDNFFQIGGDSISMVSLMNAIRDEFQVDLAFSEFLKASSIAEVAEAIAKKGKENQSVIYEELKSDKEHLYEAFPLTEVQMAYLMGRNSEIEMGGVSTHIYVELETSLEIGRLNVALQKVINRHEMLRTVFLPDGQQQIMKEMPIYTIHCADFSEASEDEREQYILKQRDRMSHDVFQADRWPLFEFSAMKQSGDKNYLFIGIDMLIADGTSLQIICKELLEYYKNPELDAKSIDFKFRDYIMGYSQFKQSGVYQKDREYWLNKLEDFPTAPQLPLKCDPREVKKPHFKRINQELSIDELAALSELAKRNQVSVSSLLCTAYADVLAFWSNQQELAINLTVFNRYPFHKDINEIIGDFTSIILLGLDLTEKESFMKRAQYVQSTMIEALEHRHYDGVELVREIAKKNNMGSKPIMPIVFTSMVNGNSIATWNDIGDMKMGISQTPQVYIDHQAVVSDGKLGLTWDYVSELFEEETITLMFQQYVTLLRNLVMGDTETGVDCGALLWNAINTYNDTKVDIEPQTLGYLFHEQVVKNPDKIALIHKGEQLTYKQLDDKSWQIAQYLRVKGVTRNDYVGVLTRRCIPTIANILGVLKAGAAYVPIDPIYPEERREYIMSNSNCRYLLTPETYVEEKLFELPVMELEDINETDDVAYVIYTSGSTGKPKGVVISHGACVNTILDINQKFKVNEEDVIIGISSMCFDLSVYDIFGSLSTGASLVLIDDQRDMQELIETVQKYHITIWNSVPAIMDIAIENLSTDFYNDTLRLVMLSGDWIPLQLPNKIRTCFERAQVVSLGGATEGSIWSIYYPVKEVKKDWKSIPYGYPLGNQKMYVLNYNQELCPLDVQGEIYIGGVGVAKGYMNDVEKTKAAFIAHPKLGNLYRTGDYGIMSQEGYIIFTGRRDYQVKISGYRVELEEIQKNLIAIEEIQNAIVIDDTNDSGKKYLCAYYVAKEELPIKDIREQLLVSLPKYMVPMYFIHLYAIPLTANGKIDRKALPKPNANHVYSVEYAEPRNEIEEMLVRTWEEVLGVSRVGIYDNFFELGGDSIKAIQIASRIQKDNYNVTLRDLFQTGTIAELSGLVTKMTLEISQAPVEGEVLLTPIQSWFFERNFTHEEQWNQSVTLYSRDGFDETVIEKVFAKIVEHHDALRMSFERQNGQVIEKNRGLDGKFFDLTIFELNGQNDLTVMRQKTAKIEAGLDLQNGPLMRLALFKSAQGDRLLITIHHLGIDGISWRILFEDLDIAFRQLKDKKEIQLQRKTTSYQDWAIALRDYAKQDELQNEAMYWSKIENTEVKPLPKDYQLEVSLRKDYREASICLSEENTQLLLREVNHAFNTEINDILLTALGLSMKAWTGNNLIRINLESHGREAVIKNVDVNRTVGWFTAMYPVLLDMSELEDIARTIKEVKEYLRHVPNKGIGYGVLRYLSDADNTNFNVIPEISFNYLGQFDQDIHTESFEIISDLTGLSASPESENPYTFMIICMIAEGKLNITYNYNVRQYEESTVMEALEQFKNSLEQIIECCTQKQDKQFTPTDYGDDNLSIADLDNILDFVDGLE